jgi:hypothetical protein
VSVARLLVIIAVLAVAPIASGASQRQGAHVFVTHSAPLTVHGWHFAPNERVTVTVTVKVKRVVTVRANGAGAFSVTFKRIGLGRCSKYAIEAWGSRGSATGFSGTCMKIVGTG